SFPGLNMTAYSIDIPGNMNLATSEQCASAEHHFAGQNRGCWSNPAYDRLYNVAISTIDPRQRDDAIVEAWSILTADVGILGMSYTPESFPIRRGLVGPGTRWSAPPGATWNVYTWHWE